MPYRASSRFIPLVGKAQTRDGNNPPGRWVCEMVRLNNPETICEDPSMRLPQLSLSSPMTSHRGIEFLLSSILLAGSGAPANAQYAGATTYLGSYSSTAPTTAPTKPPAKRATASPVAVRLSEWKLELSQLTVPTGEVES